MSVLDLSKKQQQENAQNINKNNISSSNTNKWNYPLNDFDYPACWEDDERMQVLLSAFRPRDVNPLGYDSKMRFWQQIIGQYCVYKHSALFCINELHVGFAREQRMPRCLDVVVQEMERTKAVRKRLEYEYDPLNSWTGWAVNCVVWRPLSWSVHKFKSSIGLMNENSYIWVEYVHLETMQNLCKDLLEQVLQKHQGEVLHYDAVKEEATAQLQINEECLPLCLKTLRYQNKIGLDYKQDKNGNTSQQIHLIKIPSSTNTSIIINDTDRSKHNLQCTQANLLKELQKLETEIQENATKAKECLKENKRQQAKTYLRKKHLLEASHAKRSQALHNIEKLLCSVEEALSNGEIIDAYKIGSQALQHALSSSGLSYDNVDEVVSEVRDAIETQQELQDMLATGVGVSSDDDTVDEDLNLELADLMKKPDQSPPASAKRSTAESKAKDAIATPKNTSLNAKSSPPASLPVAPATKPSPVNLAPIKLQMHAVDDEELLEMLDKLEVEDESPLNLSKKNKNSFNKLDTS